MSKKVKGGNKKKLEKGDKEALQEVDKEFYEIQITDLNQKLARLRSRCTELESENEDVKKNLDKLDEDRADIIAYLKRTLQAKSEEMAELERKLTDLQQAKDTERTMFLEKIKVMENDFKVMHEQLSSEIKLLNGKLNSLDEFRREREELMNKFIKQEEAMEEQEKRHKIALYEVERKFIIGKDELKKDMENKLLQLSLNFQKTTDIRISTTTHRVIRENVAVNNELNVILESWKALYEENIDIKRKVRELKIEADMQREDNKVLLRKNATQNKIIEKIAVKHAKAMDACIELEQIRRHGQSLEAKLEAALSELNDGKEKCQRLRQIIQSRQFEECEHELDLHELKQHCWALGTTLNAAAAAVAQASEGQEESDQVETRSQKDTLLTTLMELFEKFQLVKVENPGIKRSRLSNIESNLLSLSFKNGDLGLIPKLHKVDMPGKTSNIRDIIKCKKELDPKVQKSKTKVKSCLSSDIEQVK